MEGQVWYRSRNFEALSHLEWPSADTVSLQRVKGWGAKERDKNKGKKMVSNFLNVECMRRDVDRCTETYPDLGFFDDLKYGGDANLFIPFRSLRLEENYKMAAEGKEKLIKKLREEEEKDFITRLDTWERCMLEFPRMRVHPMGLIPKSRKDRQLRHLGMLWDVRWRTISDMKKELDDGLSVNSASGTFGSIKLPQGVRLLDMIESVKASCKKKGVEHREIVVVKWDMKSAYRNFRIAVADRWAFGFTFQGKYGVHKSWPFGNVASVYNFLRFPLLLVWYLGQQDIFRQSTAEAAMYFDDLVVIAHRTDIERVARLVEETFTNWRIPRQEEKFHAENINGFKGSSQGVILGHLYDFERGTIGIPADRVAEIVEEVQLFVADVRGKDIKLWESIIGVLAWVKVVVPQIGPALSGSYALLRTWKKAGGQGARKVPNRIKKDWLEITRLLGRWNGTMSFIRSKWPDSPNKETFGVEPELYVEPSADASGSIGWGGVCEFGYVRGLWSKEEMDMKIHIKEGLALWAVIRAFGAELRGRRMKLKQFALRSDNKVLIDGINRGRSKQEDMNIVIRMIFDALMDFQLSLSTWRVAAKTQVKVLYIGTKENVMADALSRDDLQTFRNYANDNRLTAFPKLTKHHHLGKEDMKIWHEKVQEILRSTHSLSRQTKQQQ